MVRATTDRQGSANENAAGPAGTETIEGDFMNGQAAYGPGPVEQTDRAGSGAGKVSESDTAALIAEVSGRGVGEVDLPSAETDVEISVRHRIDEDRFAAVLGEWGIGTISYREIGSIHYLHRDGVLVIDWTYLEPQFRGRGIATEFIADVLDDLRDTGSRIAVTCPVVSAFIAANPEYADQVM
jgi:predicted GNAT family acetyltransferase